jgi:hypothetical protein
MSEETSPVVDEVVSMLAGAGEGQSTDTAGDALEGSALDRALAAALAGEELDDEGTAAPGAAGVPERATGEDATPIETLADAAERLGVDAAELYKLAVPMGGESPPMTLGELKDAATEWKAGAAERIEWDTEAARQRNELANARDELQQLVALIPEQARTPEMMARATAEFERVKNDEARKLLQRVPEWRDHQRYTAEKEVRASHLEPFGFSGAELESVIDSRLMAYVRHNALREKRIAAALEASRGKREQTGPRAVSGKQPKTASKSSGDAIDAVVDLLRGSK